MATEPIDEKAVFNSARGIAAPDERAAYLQQVCGHDPDALRRILDLLRVYDQEKSFLESSPVAVLGATVDQPAGERPGDMVGPYKLLEQIGEGGFGVVFMAEQSEPVRRKVALKILKPGMDTRQVVARFEAERQALAIMDHPHIARVFDGGATPSGRPYFVMELVKGAPVTDFCDQNHLTPRQRLELFIPVCQAVQHAHQKGIIHRDLKPSNVLVSRHDATPVVKVIDFGVAKALGQTLTDKTLFTGIAQMIGTPLYMSPEQAGMSDLDVDTRSDVYSLGVLLYELLTGTTPFDKERFKKAAYDEIRRIIRDEEPPKPSTRLSDSKDSLPSISAQRQTEPAKLTRQVRGELDWIVMKALEKDRNRRYETANGFAADVQRYLNDEPVQACPPSALYRFRKFARRNRAAIGVAGMVLVFLVLLGTGAGWALRDREARGQEFAQETARRLALTEQGIGQALDRGNTSRAELHALLKKPGGVQQLLNQPARWELLIRTAQGELAQARRLAVRAEGSLDAEWTHAMDQLEQQLTSDQADYDLALRLEKIRLDCATLSEGKFGYRKAADEYPRAFAGFAVLRDDPAPTATRISSSPIKEQLVASLDDWARVASILHQLDLAEQLLAVARQAVPDPAWGDRLRQLKVWRDKDALRKLVANAPAAGLSPQLLALVGSLLRDDKRQEEASWLRQAQAEYPTDFWLNFDLGNAIATTNPADSAGFFRAALAVRPTSSAAYDNLGNAMLRQKKLDEAVACYRKALEIDPKYGNAHYGLGLALKEKGLLDAAIASFRKAIEVDPKFAYPHIALGNDFFYRQKKLDEAIVCYRKGIELAPKYALTYYSLGDALKAQGEVEEAIPYFREAVKLDATHPNAPSVVKVLMAQEKIDEATKAIELNPNDWSLWSQRAAAYFHQQRWAQAVADYSKAIELNANVHATWLHRGHAHMALKKWDRAVVDLSELLKRFPGDHNALFYRGSAHEQLNQWNQAIADHAKAIELAPGNSLAHNRLAWLLATCPDVKVRDPARAVELAEKAVRLVPKQGNVWNTLGVAHYRAGDWKAATEALNKSMELRNGGDSNEWFFLAMALWQSCEKEKARKYYDRAATWTDKIQPENKELRRFRAEAAELLGVAIEVVPPPKLKK